MFLKEKIHEINDLFEKSKSRFSIKSEEIIGKLKDLDEDEKTCFKFTYSFMPISDIVTYDVDIIIKFIKQSIMTRKTTSWGKDIPIEIFLNFVLFYRVNNEYIELYKDEFFDEIYPIVQNKNIKEAALEVNYWCFQKATYKASDSRSLSPKSVIRGALGRCGEESTLTVSAMRSVGIPARQCYTPRWAHCDDNHAWVEVWAGGRWYYMGACEPEPVLNKGWFTSSASKAMLVHSKAFSNKVNQENIIAKTPVFSTINNIGTYGKSNEIEIVVLENNKPLENITVRFELLNYSELFPIHTQKTDINGTVRFKIGMGDIYIHVTDSKRFMSQKLDVRKDSKITFDFEKSITSETGIIDFDMSPPIEDVSIMKNISSEVQALHETKIENCNKIRSDFEKTFYNLQSAKEFCEKYEFDNDQLASYLVKAKGNHKEIIQFFEEDSNSLQDKSDILKCLNEKDFVDITSTILTEYLNNAIAYKSNFPKDIYLENILSPRVQNEMILPCRSFIKSFFENKKIVFLNALSVWHYILDNIEDMDTYDYPTLIASSVGILKHGIGGKIGIDVLFVNICRTFGIPARINEINSLKEYYEDGNYIEVNALPKEECLNTYKESLTIINNNNKELTYFTNISIARLENGVYNSLSYWDKTIKDKWTVNLKAGNYRILMSSRQIDGSCFVRLYHVCIGKNQNKIVNVELRNDNISEKLKYSSIEDTIIEDFENEKSSIFSQITKSNAILAFIEVGKEPTEHLLNEIIQLEEIYNNTDTDIIMILNKLDDKNNVTLQKVISKIPKIKLFLHNNKEYLIDLHKIMGVGDERLPFVLVINKERKGLFAFSNYNVGTAEMLIRIINNGK